MESFLIISDIINSLFRIYKFISQGFYIHILIIFNSDIFLIQFVDVMDY